MNVRCVFVYFILIVMLIDFALHLAVLHYI